MKISISVEVEDNKIHSLIEALRDHAQTDGTYAISDVKDSVKEFIRKEIEDICLNLDEHAGEIYKKSNLVTIEEINAACSQHDREVEYWHLKQWEAQLSPECILRF